MTIRRWIEIIALIMIAISIYSYRSPKKASEIARLEAALETGSSPQIWSAIERLEDLPKLSREDGIRIAEKLCTLRSKPEFELIRARLRRNSAIGLGCEGP